MSKERRYAVGRDCHPTALSFVCLIWGIFRKISGKSRKECRALRNPQSHLAEAEGNLILYLPHLCLYFQLPFSLGDMDFHFSGLLDVDGSDDSGSDVGLGFF